MTYADVSDVSLRLGRPIIDSDEVAQVQSWLDDVESMIVSRFKRAGLDLDTQIAADDPTLTEVIRVEANAVVRRVNNPDETVTSVTRSVDDASITERREDSASTYAWLSEADWIDLLGAGSNTGAFSTSPGFDPDLPELVGWA